MLNWKVLNTDYSREKTPETDYLKGGFRTEDQQDEFLRRGVSIRLPRKGYLESVINYITATFK